MLALYVAIGGAIGSVLRYFTVTYASKIAGISFPYGTMFVNISGSLLMGLLVGYLSKTMPHSLELRLFAAVGILGGYTTFSAFSMDAISLFENGQIYQSFIYVLLSVTLSIFAVFIGLFLMRT